MSGESEKFNISVRLLLCVIDSFKSSDEFSASLLALEDDWITWNWNLRKIEFFRSSTSHSIEVNFQTLKSKTVPIDEKLK